MNSNNTVVYIKINGRNREGFVDPLKFEWNSTKDKELWAVISKLETLDNIDWNKLSKELNSPEYFVRKRSYTIFTDHLKRLEEEIGRNTKELKITLKETNQKPLLEVEDVNFLNDPTNSKITRQQSKIDELACSSLSELSNLSISNSALEEALMDRLKL